VTTTTDPSTPLHRVGFSSSLSLDLVHTAKLSSYADLIRDLENHVPDIFIINRHVFTSVELREKNGKVV